MSPANWRRASERTFHSGLLLLLRGRSGRALDGRLGVAVAGESLDVDFGDGQLVRQIVRVVDAARLGEPLVQGGLLPQHLGEVRVAVLAVARVQSLSKCVHYADLKQAAAKTHRGGDTRPRLVIVSQKVSFISLD